MTPNKPKHIFCAIKLSGTSFRNENAKIAAFCDIKLEASNLVATKPNDGLGKIKGQKRSFGRKERKSLFSETYC